MFVFVGLNFEQFSIFMVIGQLERETLNHRQRGTVAFWCVYSDNRLFLMPCGWSYMLSSWSSYH